MTNLLNTARTLLTKGDFSHFISCLSAAGRVINPVLSCESKSDSSSIDHVSSILCNQSVLLGVTSYCLWNESIQYILVRLKATLVISQKCVALGVSLLLFRAVTRESMDLEKQLSQHQPLTLYL